MSAKRLIVAAGAIVVSGLLGGIAVIVYLNSTGTSEATRKLELCAALTQAERFGEAASVCSEAIALSPESPEPYHNRALAYLDAGRSADARSDAEKGCTLGLEEACDLDVPYSVEEGFRILPKMVVHEDDLPFAMSLVDSSFRSLDEEADRYDSDAYRSLLVKTGFILTYDTWFQAGRDGLPWVFSQVWLHDHTISASAAYTETVTQIVSGWRWMIDFPKYGDASRAFRTNEPWLNASGREVLTEGYTVFIRIGAFVGIVRIVFPEGTGDEDSLRQLAEAMEANMKTVLEQ